MLIDRIPNMHSITLVMCVALGAVSMAIALMPKRRGRDDSLGRSVIAAAAVAVILRGLFSLVQPGATYDLNSYSLIGSALRHGVSVYSAVGAGHYNYPPVEMWWSALVSSVFPGGPSDHFAALVKVPFWLADAAIVLAIALLAPAGRRHHAAWLYALNPIAITVACLHGQFDALVILPLLLCVGYLKTDRDRSSLSFGVALAVKTWPLLVLPALLSALPRRHWPRYLGIAALPGVVGSLLYLLVQHSVDLGAAFQRVFGYVPPPSTSFGVTLAASAPLRSKLDVLLVVLLIAIAYLEGRRGRRLEPRVALAAFLVVALSPTVGNQYYVWPIAFLLVAGQVRIAGLYTALVGPAVAYVALYVNAPPYVSTPPLYAHAMFVIASVALVALSLVLLYQLATHARSWHPAGALRVA